MRVKKTTVQLLIGAVMMFGLFPVGTIPTIEFGEYGFLQGGIAMGLFMFGLLIMLHATINDHFNLNEKRHYFFIKEEKNETMG